MDVVLGSGWPGILLHEAIGHGLEGDFNRKGVSAFSGRIGQRVASELCTVVDDGTMPGRRGSLNVDDEGTPTSRTVLVENGILRGYLQDRLNARLMGVAPTGNGRRESYAHMPMPRMTNTFMLSGRIRPRKKSLPRSTPACMPCRLAVARSTLPMASSSFLPTKPISSSTANSPVRSKAPASSAMVLTS